MTFLLGSLAGSENSAGKDRFTGEKQTNFIKFLHVDGAFTRERKPEEVTRAGFYTLETEKPLTGEEFSRQRVWARHNPTRARQSLSSLTWKRRVSLAKFVRRFFWFHLWACKSLQ